MEKLNLRGLWTIQDHHIKEIITRCKNLTELELRYTQITDKSINTLIEYASENLVKLGVDTYSNVEFFKILELKSMSKLKVLNFYGEDLGLMNSEGEPVSDARLRCYVEALVLQLKLFEL